MIQSISITLNALGEELYLNGLALVDDRTGNSVSPLVAPQGGLRRIYSGDIKLYQNDHALPAAFLVHLIQAYYQRPGCAQRHERSDVRPAYA